MKNILYISLSLLSLSAFAQNKAEKEALKIYEAEYGNIQAAIDKIEEDRKALGIGKYLDFARQVNSHQKVMSQWK